MLCFVTLQFGSLPLIPSIFVAPIIRSIGDEDLFTWLNITCCTSIRRLVASVDDKIDFRFLGKVISLEPDSIRLGGDAISTNEDLLTKALWTEVFLDVAATKEDPVLVNVCVSQWLGP